MLFQEICKKRLTLQSSLLIFIVVAGCNHDDKKTNEKSAALAELQGGWGLCDNSATAPFFGVEAAIQDNKFTQYLVEYNEPECITRIHISNSGSGSIIVGNTVVTPGGITAREIDSLYEDAQPNSAEANAPAGDTTQSTSTRAVILSNSKYYNIFYIDQDQLYFGDITTGDASTAANRPTDIDFDFQYDRREAITGNTPGSSASDTTPVIVGNSPGDSSINPPVNNDPTVLEGNWAACDTNSTTPFTGSELGFLGNTWKINKIEYAEADCTTQTNTQTSLQGTFVVGNNVTSQSGVIATELDLTATGNTGSGTVYEIFYIDQNNLYLGDFATGDASTIANRPTDINFNAWWNQHQASGGNAILITASSNDSLVQLTATLTRK